MFDPALFATFLRTLGLVAPLVGVPGATVLANAAASLLEAGADGYERLKALTEQMRLRHEAGQTTTAEEILADVARIQALDAQIQQGGRARIGMLALLVGLALSVAAVAATVGASWTNAVQNTDNSPIAATGPGALATTTVEWSACGPSDTFTTRAGVLTVPATQLAATLADPGTGRWCYRALHTNNGGVSSDPTAVLVKDIPVPKPKPPGGFSLN